jgi:tripartite-type tricarboxylate transporter receptor subunit TctC
MKTRLADLGAEPGTFAGAAFGKFLADDTAKWAKVIKLSGATMD